MRSNENTAPGCKWVVAAVCFVTVLVVLGFCSGIKGVYLKTVSESLNVSRGAFSVNDIIRYGTTAILTLFFGTLIAKLRAKRMMLLGVCSLIGSMLCCAAARNVWLIYAGALFLGVGLAWCTTTMIGYVVGQWFTKERGTVMGVILASNGLGIAVATQLLRPIIIGERYVFGHTGWRLAYLLTAALLAVVFLLILILFREAPERPDQRADAPKKGRGRQWVGMEWRQIRRKPYFYAMLVCVFLAGLCLQSATGISTAHLEDVGLDSAYITNIISLYALVLCVAKILTGFVFDGFGLRATALACTSAGALAIFLLASVTPAAPGAALAYELIMPFGLPMETVMLPLIAADMFGEKCFAKVMGIVVAVNTAGYAAGSLLTNVVFDLLGSYKNALLLYAGLLLVVAVAFQLCLIPAGRDRKKILAADVGTGPA